jgi:hypothetical protein
MNDEQVNAPLRCCGNCLHWSREEKIGYIVSVRREFYCECIKDGDDRTDGNEVCAQWLHDTRERHDADRS